MSKRKKNKPDDIIAGRGSEREGACNEDSQWFTHDGSVEVVGSHDPDDCSCYDYCECEECERCSYCERYPDDCECDDCQICGDCESNLDDCDCGDDRLRHCLLNKHQWSESELISEFDLEDNMDDVENATLNDMVQFIMDNYWDLDWLCHDCEYAHDNRIVYNCHLGTNGVSQYCDHDCECYCECSSGEGTDGELVSPVLRTQKEMIEWNEENHPYEVNSSCGHHEHRSTKLLAHHCVLAEKEFTTYLIKETYKWAEKNKINKGSALYERLKGNNHYCKNAYRFYEQVLDTDHYPDSRYCFVNYCWQKHGTMEIRLAPEFKKNELNVKWAVFVDEVVTNFINRHKNTVVDHNESVLF